MTAQKLSNNFMTNFWYKVKSNKRISIVLFVLHFISAPLILINCIVYLKQTEAYEAAKNLLGQNGGELSISSPDFPYAYVVIGVIATALAALAGIIIALNSFNYLYKKSNVDMALSLPLTTNQRFFSDFLAGLTTYLAPFILSSIFALIINGIGSIMVPKYWNDISSQVGFSTITDLLIKLIICGFFIMLMLYVVTVLITTCCGSILEAIGYTIIANGLVPGILMVSAYLFLGNLYGIEYTESIIPILTKTSPFGGIVSIFYNIFDYSGDKLYSIYTSWLIPFIIVTAIYFGLSWLLYYKRKAEDVSKPFVYKGFYYVMITGITFCIASIFSFTNLFVGDKISILSAQVLIPLIIFSAVAYLIFEVITNRGFKKFWMSVIRYAITITAVITVIFICNKTEGFGITYYIPDNSQITSVETDYNGQFSESGYEIKLKDKDNINRVKDFQKTVLENYKKSSKDTTNNYYYNNKYRSIKITYNLINGSKVSRRYNVSIDEAYLLKDIDLTDEFIDGYISKIRSDFVSFDYDNGYYRNYVYKPYYNSFETKNVFNEKPSIEEVDSMLNAIKTDMKSITPEQYFTPDKKPLGTLEIGGVRIFINENYPNTIKFLKNQGIDALKDKNSILEINDNYIIVITKPNNSDKDGNVINTTMNSGKYDVTQNFYSERVFDFDSKLMYLSSVLQPQYVTDKAVYCLSINGQTYAIPEEYSEQAKSIYEKAKEYRESYVELNPQYPGTIITSDNSNYYFSNEEEYNAALKDVKASGLEYKIIIQDQEFYKQ